MAENGADARDQLGGLQAGERNVKQMGEPGPQPDHGQVALKGIHQQNEDSGAKAQDANGIGRSDIPAADRPDIDALGLGHQEAGGTGSQQISSGGNKGKTEKWHREILGAAVQNSKLLEKQRILLFFTFGSFNVSLFIMRLAHLFPAGLKTAK